MKADLERELGRLLAWGAATESHPRTGEPAVLTGSAKLFALGLHIDPHSCVHGPMEAQARDVQFAHERDAMEGASFEAFFAAEWARLFRAVILLTGSREEAEDVT